MQARGNAPERASGTARYGLRWHARDRARLAHFWLVRASMAEIIGVFYLVAGPVLLASALISHPADAWGYVPGPAMVLVGAALVAVNRIWGWRR